MRRRQAESEQRKGWCHGRRRVKVEVGSKGQKPGRRKKKTDRERMMCEVGMKSRVAGKERWKKSMEEREACTEDKTGRGKR